MDRNVRNARFVKSEQGSGNTSIAKKVMAVICVAMMLFSTLALAGCSEKDDRMSCKGRFVMAGRVWMIVVDSDDPMFADMHFATLQDATGKDQINNLKVGDHIEIRFNQVMELYPPIVPVEKCKVLKSGSIADVDAEMIEELEQCGRHIKDGEHLPIMTVYSEEQIVTAETLTSSWSYVDAQGQEMHVERDCIHPLELLNRTEATLTSAEALDIALEFSQPASNVSVIRWSKEYAEDISSHYADEELVLDEWEYGVPFEAAPGYVYQVEAHFEQGTVDFAFVIE